MQRWRRRFVPIVAAAMIGATAPALAPAPAGAVSLQEATVTTTLGDQLRVAIDTLEPGDTAVAGEPITLTGQVQVTPPAGRAGLDVLTVLDPGPGLGGDCDGDGLVNENPNDDGVAGGVDATVGGADDCQIIATQKILAAARRYPAPTRRALFMSGGGIAQLADMSPDAQAQPEFYDLDRDGNADGTSDVDQVLASWDAAGDFAAWTSTQVLNNALDLTKVLESADSAFASSAPDTAKLLYVFLSNAPAVSNRSLAETALASLAAKGVRVHVISFGDPPTPGFTTTTTGPRCEVDHLAWLMGAGNVDCTYHAGAHVVLAGVAPPVVPSVRVSFADGSSSTPTLGADGAFSLVVDHANAGADTLSVTATLGDATTAKVERSMVFTPAAGGARRARALTSTGQSLELDVTSITPSARVPATTPIDVAASARVGNLDAVGVDVVTVMDLSASTTSVKDMNCDGVDGSGVTATDDLDGDGLRGTILDCQIAAALQLNDSLAAVRDVAVSFVGFAGSTGVPQDAAAADVLPGFPSGNWTSPDADLDGNGRGDAADVMRNVAVRQLGLFTYKQLPAAQTNYEAAMMAMNDLFAGRPAGRLRVAYFISDGAPTVGADAQQPIAPRAQVARAQQLGLRIHSFAVTTAADGCARALGDMATKTGGSCLAVTDPAQLVPALATPVTLQSISAALGSDALGSTTTGALSVTIPGRPAGLAELAVTATASDGSTARVAVPLEWTGPPVVSEDGPYTGVEGSPVLIDGVTAQDPDGGALDYEWTVDPGAGSITHPSSATPVFLPLDEGTHELRLRVTDDESEGSSAVVPVVVANVAPTLVGPTLATALPEAGVPVELQLAVTDPGIEDDLVAKIDWGDGTTEVRSLGQGSFDGSFSHVYPTSGSPVVTVTVRDGDGGEASGTAAFTVASRPTVDAGGVYEGVEGTPVPLDRAVATDADGDPLSLSWTPADGIDAPSTRRPSFLALDDNGTGTTLTLTASDGQLQASSSATVIVRNAPPVLGPVTGLPNGPVLPGEPVAVAGSFSDAGVLDEHVVSVDWGDGGGEPVPHDAGKAFSGSHRYATSGVFDVVVTVDDLDGGTAEVAVGRVVVNRPPVVALDPVVVAAEGTPATLAAAVADPDGDPLTLLWAIEPMAADAGATCIILDPTAANTMVTCDDDGTFAATLTVSDGVHPAVEASTVIAVENVTPTVVFATPAFGTVVPVGTVVTATAGTADAGANDTVGCVFAWDDGQSATPASSCSAAHTFTAPGVYTLSVTATDDDDAAATAETMVVVYDPAAGFVTGGGWIDSRPGAYRLDPTAAGRANFGFVSKYQRGAATPTGQTEFQFKAAGLDFVSTSYQWLVVSGSRAQYKGNGSANGQPGYGFLLTAYDGGKTGADRFRIKITRSSDGAVVYDNNVSGGSDDLDRADPQAITGGSIVIHK